MEDYQEFTYKLTVTAFEKPDVSQLFDFVNELGDLLECKEIEIEVLEND